MVGVVLKRGEGRVWMGVDCFVYYVLMFLLS